MTLRFYPGGDESADTHEMLATDRSGNALSWALKIKLINRKTV